MADGPVHPLTTGVRVAVAALIVVPIAAMLAVFSYAHEEPSLWGIPFFYWYQLLWVVLGSACAATAYAVIERSRRGGGS